MRLLRIHSGSCAPAFNMALDEALLEAMPRLRLPVLRFYGWTEPAATFGYFQPFAAVQAATRLRPLIRRPTGGGMVPHDRDWTYAAVFPVEHEWYSLQAEASYRRMHEWLRLAFAEIRVESELAPCRAKPVLAVRQSAPPSACFVGYEKSDLLWAGKKIAGAAQRRTRGGLLIQGSVQPPPIAPPRADWESAVCAAAVRIGTPAGPAWVPDAELLQRTKVLIREKYESPAYHQKR